MENKVEAEFVKYQNKALSQVEQDYIAEIKRLETIAKSKQ